MKTLCGVFLLLIGGFALSFAQAQSSTPVTIQVEDPSKAPIPQAQVTIAPESFPRKLETNERGVLTVDLPPGSYEVSVSMRGFRTTTKTFRVSDPTGERVGIVLPVGGCPPGPCIEVTQDPSSDSQAVWKLEETYWKYVQTYDLDGYRSLWHPAFLGWPYVSPEPVRKDHITDWMEAYRKRGFRLESFDLVPAGSQKYAENVVTFYLLTAHWAGKNGQRETSASRLTHTWVKSGTGWQIISGMSAAVPNSTKP